ncbi:MAG: hypothetical protein OEQ53_07915 [Saprospiraceae bacterium]|nr:hypothetical protein [Saprospiraceae bacterium]
MYFIVTKIRRAFDSYQFRGCNTNNQEANRCDVDYFTFESLLFTKTGFGHTPALILSAHPEGWYGVILLNGTNLKFHLHDRQLRGQQSYDPDDMAAIEVAPEVEKLLQTEQENLAQVI